MKNENTSQNASDDNNRLILPNAAAVTSETIINSGEIFTNSTINSGETLTISSGGSSTYITLNGGIQYISSGGTDEDGIVYVGSQYIYSGGNVINTSVYSNGAQYVSGGNVSTVTIMSGATQYVNNGIVSDATISGTQYVSGGNVSTVSVLSGAIQYVYDGIVNDATISGTQYISGGNIATVSVLSGATQYIYGGIVSDVIVSGTQYVSGGSVSTISTLSDTTQYVYDGVISNAIINGTQYVSGGQIQGLQLYGRSRQHIATQYLFSGAAAENIIVSGAAVQYVYGGTVSGASVIGANGNDASGNSNEVDAPRQYIASGGVVTNVLLSGGVASVVHESVINGTQTIIISKQAYQYVLDGGTVNGGTMQGGVQTISSGGIVNNMDMFEGYLSLGMYFPAHVPPVQYIYNGGIANKTNIFAGVQSVTSGGTAKDTIVTGGEQCVFLGGIISNTIISAGGLQTIFSGGVVYDNIIDGGLQHISSGAIVNNTNFKNGTISVYSGGTTVGDLTLPSGGYLHLENGGNLEGNVTLNPGGSVTIGLSNGGSVDLIGNNNSGLTISGYTAGVNTSVSTEIKGFSGLGTNLSDKVTVDGLKAANVSSVTYPDDNHITLQLSDGTSLTLNMTGIKQTGYTLGSDADGNLTMVVCFLSGTMIRMIDGHCAVEDIQVGDTVLTYNAQTKKKVSKKVTWVGKQTARVHSELPDDQAGYPVRILKDTFKKGVPNKDLLVTPEHCLFIDKYFIPARMLVNGRSIFYDYSITSYEYYHIETEDHSIIWADGMLTESYLNTGNRHQFNRDEKIVTLDYQVKTWEQDAAASLTVNRSTVEPIFNRLARRASQQNILLQNERDATLYYDHGLYLVTEDGKELHHCKIDGDQFIFTLPANTQNIYLISKTSRPCDVIGPFVDDRRNLGVLVGKVSVLNEYGSYSINKYLKEKKLQGWSVPEQSPCRWTMGCALLPLEVYNIEDEFTISIQILAAGPYLVKQAIDDNEEEQIAV